MNGKRFKTEIMIGAIGFLSAIIGGILTSSLSGIIGKNNELETRMFELKKNVYETFLGEYFNSFNNNNFKNKYKENFEDIIAFNLHGYCSIGRSDAVLANIKTIKQDLEKNILNCYYDYPSRCNSNTCYGLDYKKDLVLSGLSIPEIIGSSQDEAVKQTVSDIFLEFKKNTYKYQLLLPKDIYSRIFNEIEKRIYVATNSYNDCNGGNNAECGFNFQYFNINGKEDILINNEILNVLRDDIQKHY